MGMTRGALIWRRTNLLQPRKEISFMKTPSNTLLKVYSAAIVVMICPI